MAFQPFISLSRGSISQRSHKETHHHVSSSTLLKVKSAPHVENIQPSPSHKVKNEAESCTESKASLKYGLMLSSFSDGVLQQHPSHPSKLFFQLSLSSILLTESINQVQDAIKSSVEYSPCAGPNIDLLNLLERGDVIHNNLNRLMESTFFDESDDENKSLDSMYSFIDDQNDTYDEMIKKVFNFIHDSSSSTVVSKSTSSYPPTIRILFIPTAMYALRKDSKNSPGKQRQRNRADGKKRRNLLVQFIESLFTTADNGDEEDMTRLMEGNKNWEYTNSILNTCAITLDLDDGSIKQPIAKSSIDDEMGDIIFPKDGHEALTQWKPHLIFVSGGNTFWLKHCIDKGNWSQLIKDACSNASNDCPSMYVGVSAGAIVAGKYVDIASWKVRLFYV